MYVYLTILILGGDGHEWHEWKFSCVTKGYWKTHSNRRRYLEWLGNKLGFSCQVITGNLVVSSLIIRNTGIKYRQQTSLPILVPVFCKCLEVPQS